MATVLLIISAATCDATLSPVHAMTVAEQSLLSSANRDRASHGLRQLHLDVGLAQAALAHARQMVLHDDISHQFPGELELSARGAAAGAHFSLITENVAEAPDPATLHELWMHSEGHRANLLDPEVDSVGISVIVGKDQFFAVEDFANTVDSHSFADQELAITELIASSGIHIADAATASSEDARKTCSMSTGYAGHQRPWFVMRFTADSLTELPTELKSRLHSGEYHQAAVGACTDTTSGPFSGYNIAVLLYP
jgi:hypothetical protein